MRIVSSGHNTSLFQKADHPTSNSSLCNGQTGENTGTAYVALKHPAFRNNNTNQIVNQNLFKNNLESSSQRRTRGLGDTPVFSRGTRLGRTPLVVIKRVLFAVRPHSLLLRTLMYASETPLRAPPKISPLNHHYLSVT